MELIKFKYIHFEQMGHTGKTAIYICQNTENGSVLGYVKWFARWRKYAFFPVPEVVFETQCLKDIASFLDYIMNERKIKTQQDYEK